MVSRILLAGVALSAAALVCAQGKDAAPGPTHFPIGVRITVSDKAGQLLAQKNETIIVLADYFGNPSKAAIARKVQTDELNRIDLGDERVEIGKPGEAMLTGNPLKRGQLQHVDAKGAQVKISAFSGRRSSKDNLLTCDYFEGPLADAAKKPLSLRCKLNSER